MGLFFRSMLGGVQNGENADAASVNPVGNNIGCTRHNEFARVRFTARMTKVGMLGKPVHGCKDALSQSTRSRRLVLFDIITDADKVGDGRFGPDYLHDGGGNSRLLPQERSQRAVFS